MYYKIPDEEIELVGDENFPTIESSTELGSEKLQMRTVRTLGGMRLKYQYHPPERAKKAASKFAVEWEKIEKIEWKFGQAGWFCEKPGVEYSACTHRNANEINEQTKPIGIIAKVGNQVAPLEDWAVWWEPGFKVSKNLPDAEPIEQADWTLPGNKEININAEYKATLETMAPSVQKFVVQRRMISPKLDAAGKPMAGSDVQMLEQLLWQLGLSPQRPGDAVNSNGDTYWKKNSGDEGNRVLSDRGGSLGSTETCLSEQDQKHNVYLSGWASCNVNKVAIEGMIKRFQARSFLSKTDWRGSKTFSGIAFEAKDEKFAKENIDGYLGGNSIKKLGVLWSQYSSAFQNYSDPKTDSLITTKDSRLALWITDMLTIFDGAYSGIEATYTNKTHADLMVDLGKTGESFSRVQLFLKWKEQGGGTQWGKGHPKTPFRTFLGGADEYGSIGFSQILHMYRYGTGDCKAHVDAGLNYYDSRENIMGMGIHLASSPTVDRLKNCPGSFYYAFGREAKSISGLSLVGYMDKEGKIAYFTSNQETDYEGLSRGIAGYNGGDVMHEHSWPAWIKSTPAIKIGNIKNKYGTRCPSCTYAVNIKNEKFGLEKRTYIWKGGNYASTHEKAGQDWCFAYGETEWINPGTVAETKIVDEQVVTVTRNKNFNDYLKDAKKDENLQLSCS